MIYNIYQLIILFIFFLLFTIVKKNSNKSVVFFNIEYTTFMRGIAILFVVLHHVGNYSGSVIFTPLGGVGVAMFLIISGYGLNESLQRKGTTNYWRNKFVRVILPMLVIEFLSIIINEEDRLSVKDTLSHLLCIDRNWYIRYLFYWYFFFYISVKIAKQNYEFVLLLFGGGMLFVLPEIEAEQSLSFVTGVLLSKNINKIKMSKKQILEISSVLFVLGSVCLCAKQMPVIRTCSGSVSFFVLQMCLKLSIACGVLMSCSVILNNWKPTFLYFTGLMSYELYLVHCKLLGIVHHNNSFFYLFIFYILAYVSSYMLFSIDRRVSKKLC